MNNQARSYDATKPVGIWIRVSTEDQARGESPEHHEKRARMYAEAKGWDVVVVYHLEAVSGKSVMGHPETKKMLDDIKSKRISGLIFSKLARLARNTRELLEFSDIFRANNTDLISLQESIDTSSPAGRLFYTMIAAMAQWEREEISERVAASVPIRAKLGKSLGGAAPFGYQWQDKLLMPNPAEAPIRRRIYELFLEHRRKKTVARLLNEAGHRTRNGSAFSDTTITRLLRDPTAKGLRRANYTKSLGEKKHWRFKPESDWIFGEIEAIVPEDLWTQCNQILDEQLESHPLARPGVQLFTGILKCSCGQKMYVPSWSPKYSCRKCRRKILCEAIEDIYRSQLGRLSPQILAAHFSDEDKAIEDQEALLQSLQKGQEALSREMERLYRSFQAEETDGKTFGKLYPKLEARLDQLTDESAKLQGQIDAARISRLSAEEVVDQAADLANHWPNLPLEDRRRIVEMITQEIVVDDDEITVRFEALPFSRTDHMKATQAQGFIAATNIMRAGKRTLPSTRVT